MMNPETNRFEILQQALSAENEKLAAKLSRATLVRPNGEPVPPHWPVFAQSELVELKGYTFKVAHIGESYLVLEPTGPLVVGKDQSSP